MAEPVKIIIVEDEVILGQGLRANLLKMGYNEVLLLTTPDAVQLKLMEEIPDLLIVDINLGAQIDGIELMERVLEKYNLPFIFLTSYTNDELVERAKQLRPSAYMLKPYNSTAIKISIEMALNNFLNQEVSHQAKKENKEVMVIKDSLFLKNGSHFEKVAFDQILWLEADNNYTEIHTTNQTFVYSTVLKKLIPELPADHFYRVHRSYVINKTCITGFEGHMIWINDKKIPVSRQYREEVFAWFHVL